MNPPLRGLGFMLGTLAVFSARLAADASSEPQLSQEQSDWLEQRGYYTPAFQAAVHDLVQTRQTLAEKKLAEKKLEENLPDLRQRSAQEAAQLASLQKELNLYQHPEDADYDALQRAMKDPAASAQDRLVLAQAFVWSYPTDPRQADAVQDLQLVQKQLADQSQAEKDAAAARAAARADLIRRAQARDLSLEEWKSFLRDMSQEDLITYLGQPQTTGPDYWVYPGAWTSDPATKAKGGLEIFFNGTRVTSVSEIPNPP
jgi:hypothetical protein